MAEERGGEDGSDGVLHSDWELNKTDGAGMCKVLLVSTALERSK